MTVRYYARLLALFLEIIIDHALNASLYFLSWPRAYMLVVRDRRWRFQHSDISCSLDALVGGRLGYLYIGTGRGSTVDSILAGGGLRKSICGQV